MQSITDTNPYSDMGLKVLSRILKEHGRFLWLDPRGNHIAVRALSENEEKTD